MKGRQLMEDLLMNIMLSFGMFIVGGLFLSGFWRGTYRYTINFDKLFFSDARDRRVLKIADQWAFVVCLVMALCTLANGIASHISPDIPNVSALFLFTAVILSFPVRFIFTIVYKNKKYEAIPVSWPFRNKRIAAWIDD